MSDIERLKVILRERDIPFFTDAELEFYLQANNGNFDATAYQTLIIKSEDTTLNVSGLNIADSSKYFKRIASMYKPNNSGTLAGG